MSSTVLGTYTFLVLGRAVGRDGMRVGEGRKLISLRNNLEARCGDACL
jgi:hypothetical protein